MNFPNKSNDVPRWESHSLNKKNMADGEALGNQTGKINTKILCF